MQYRELGSTGLEVSELCFGVLPMGPLQANLPVEEGGTILRQALENGVNFLDTAEAYRTYDYISYALNGYEGDVIIASKSTAEDYAGMEEAIQTALKGIRRDVIDIFHLHAPKETPDVFNKREGALRCLLDYKQKGYIRAVGVSTHNVQVVEKAASVAEIDVVYPIINKIGKGILNGNVEDMLQAINKCHQRGKGLYAMKVLAGGNLVNDLFSAIDFVRSIKEMHSISIGMINQEELSLNLKIFNNEKISEDILPQVIKLKKLLILERFCKKCGSCIEACHNEALYMGDNAVKVDHDRCLLCGYCYAACPEFVIRMI